MPEVGYIALRRKASVRGKMHRSEAECIGQKGNASIRKIGLKNSKADSIGQKRATSRITLRLNVSVRGR